MEKNFEHHTNYDLIMPGKSWIFINPATGCPLKCAYCVEQKDSWFNGNLTTIYSSSETMEKVLDSPLIIKDKSPLTFYNFSDPFLPKNKEGLLAILEELDRREWKNKIGLISKIHPGEDYLDELKGFKNLKIGLFVSYANLIPGLESVSYEQRVKLMEDSKGRGIKVIDYVRPLVREWTNEKRLIDLASQIKGKVDATSLSGIRLTPEIVESLKVRGIKIPEIKTYTNKQRDDELSNIATKIISQVAQIPVFWHTSCAMSYLFEEPDYNSHDIREKRKKDTCGFPCVNSQREICYSRKCSTSDDELEKTLARLGKKVNYKREKDTILLSGGQLNKEDISFVRHVIPEFVIKNG
jgi:DNA repair photolyase